MPFSVALEQTFEVLTYIRNHANTPELTQMPGSEFFQNCIPKYRPTVIKTKRRFGRELRNV